MNAKLYALNVNSIQTSTTAKTSNVHADSMDHATASRAGASYGAAVQQSAKHDTSVRAVANNYDNFEDALLPMVLASGVAGDAAVHVASAIKAHPGLRAQAERAFQRARMESVD